VVRLSTPFRDSERWPGLLWEVTMLDESFIVGTDSDGLVGMGPQGYDQEAQDEYGLEHGRCFLILILLFQK
jgi:hypothetical protein